MVRATHMLSHCYSASLFCSARVVRVAASAVIYKGKEYGCTVSMLHPNTTYKYVGLSCRYKPCTLQSCVLRVADSSCLSVQVAVG